MLRRARRIASVFTAASATSVVDAPAESESGGPEDGDVEPEVFQPALGKAPGEREADRPDLPLPRRSASPARRQAECEGGTEFV